MTAVSCDSIEVRGVVYPNAKAAAAALGVTVQTVRVACRAGRAHRIGLGRCGKEPMAISIRGTVYKDAYEAGAALGVSAQAVYQALHKERIDRVGLPHRSPKTTANARPFCVGTLSFPSMRSASLCLGFAPNYISQSYAKDRSSAKERIFAAAMAYAARNERSGDQA